MAGQLESYMVGEPMPMANIHSVFRWVHTITKKHHIPKKHFYLPKSTEKTNARRGLYALWLTILCVLGNKDVYMWQEKVYDPKRD